MISLRTLLIEEHDDVSVWQTKHRYWGAKNSIGQRRYFYEKEDATKFAEGDTKGPVIGKPEPKKRPEYEEPKQRYAK